MRLQKYMAQAGVASRRKSEKIILDGRVKVNGAKVTKLGTKINPKEDIIQVDNKRINMESTMIYIMLNKPISYVTTVKDEFNRKTVLDLVKGVEERIYPVGRLDYDTSGLLLLTNDGDVTYKMTHPSFEIDKTYIGEVKGVLTEDEIKRFEEGLIIDGYKTWPAKIKILKENVESSILKITIHEGRNRQVRKMCEAINHPIINLKRVSIGEINLESLNIGEWRFLRGGEIEYIKSF